METLVAQIQIMGNDKTGIVLNEESSRQNGNDKKDPRETKESIHETLTNVAEVSEVRFSSRLFSHQQSCLRTLKHLNCFQKVSLCLLF